MSVRLGKKIQKILKILLISIIGIFFQQYEEQQRRNKEAEFTELVRDFLNPGEFYNACVGLGIDYFTGVPDSLLKGSKLKILCNLKKVKHLATN